VPETKFDQPVYAPADPGPEHALLKPFEGVFNAIVKLWLGPDESLEQPGVMTNTFQLAGFFLHQDYVGEQHGFAGKGYWGFNQTDRKYEGFWIDTASSTMLHESGDVDESGTIWTMHSSATNPETGDVMTKRSVIRLIDNDHHIMELFLSVDGRPEFRNMEIQYTRA